MSTSTSHSNWVKVNNMEKHCNVSDFQFLSFIFYQQRVGGIEARGRLQDENNRLSCCVMKTNWKSCSDITIGGWEGGGMLW